MRGLIKRKHRSSITLLFLALFLILPARAIGQLNEPSAISALYDGRHLFYDHLDYFNAYYQLNYARHIAAQKDMRSIELESLWLMGKCAFFLNAIDSCISHLNKAALLAHTLCKTEDELEILDKLRSVYIQYQADYQTSALIENKMDSITRNSTRMSMRMEMYNSFAQEAYMQQNKKLAEYYLLQSENLIDSLHLDVMAESERLYYAHAVYDLLFKYYSETNNYQKALDYFHLLIDTSKRKFKIDNKEYMAYKEYDSEAYLHSVNKNKEAAYAALDSMRYGLTLGDNIPPIFNMYYYYTSGNIYLEFEEWDKACDAFSNAVSAVAGTSYEQTEDFANVLIQYSGALAQTGHHELAREGYERYASYCQQHFGEKSAQYHEALWYYTNFLWNTGDSVEAGRSFIKSVDILKDIISNRLVYLPLQERGHYWEHMAPYLWAMPYKAFVMDNTQSEFLQKSYDALLFSKALLFESERMIATAIESECQASEKTVYHKMMGYLNKLTNLSKNFDLNNNQIRQVQDSILLLNKQLNPILRRIGCTSFQDLNYTDIKNSLKDEEALLDFSDFYYDLKEKEALLDLTELDNENDSVIHQYCVFIIDKQQQAPVREKLFKMEDMDSLLNGLPLDRLFDGKTAGQVQNLIWKPMEKHVVGKRTIYYIPSGILHQIALESIPMGDGSLLGEHYNFIRLTNAREVGRYRNNISISPKSTALLYGGLKYTLDDATMQIAAAKYNLPLLYTMRGTLRGDSIFHELPHALEEVTGTKKILDKQGVRAEVMSGADGTEESFISLDGKAPQILHLSTHGFYYTPEQASEVSYLKGHEDAMALSGLILSGGNAAWLGRKLPQGVLGGVLTANTIARLNLKGTDLLFLAACQTGNGKVTPEGIYGLQRAFKKAGVKTIVMSLWDVDDKVAKEFSVSFYEELTKNGWDKRKAFEKAKSRIRKMEDYKEPFYWAGFVMLD